MRKPDRTDPPGLFRDRYTDTQLYFRNRVVITASREVFADANPHLDSLTIWGKMKKQQKDGCA